MYGMGLIVTLCHNASDLNLYRCLQMCLIHDLAESLTGDVTPECGVSKTEKSRLEEDAIRQICQSLGLESSEGRYIHELWSEYEAGTTLDSRFVHEVDKLEFAMQAHEYQKKYKIDFDDFMRSTSDRISHPLLRPVMDSILDSIAKPKQA